MSSKLKLVQDLNAACLRYLELRIEWFKTKQEGKDISDVDDRRTQAHNALIACFNATLRNLEEKPEDMVQASRDRVAIGNWALSRSLHLLKGSKAPTEL